MDIATPQRSTERSSLMNIGRRVDYAVRALTYLAAQRQDRVVPRREIQTQQDIPAHFLSKIMKQLAGGDLVESSMGARGGFRLKKPASEISVRAVYECLEGPLLLMECLDEDDHACCYHPICNQISVWGEAQRLLGSYLGGVSIGQIAHKVGLREELAHQEQGRYRESARYQSVEPSL